MTDKHSNHTSEEATTDIFCEDITVGRRRLLDAPNVAICLLAPHTYAVDDGQVKQQLLPAPNANNVRQYIRHHHFRRSEPMN